MHKLNNNGAIERFQRGVYYKPKFGIFGKVPLDPYKVVKKKYIQNNNEVIGYETGASLFQRLGLTTQIPRYKFVASNIRKNDEHRMVNEVLKVVVRGPRTRVTKDNFKYLQILDALENKDAIYLDTKDIFNHINYFIETNHLDFRKLVGYARKHYTQKTLEKVIKLAEVSVE